MKKLWALGILAGSLVLAGVPPADTNVNTRYLVEAIELPDTQAGRISAGLRDRIRQLIGSRLDPASLEDLALRLRNELRARAVTHSVARGSTPDTVKVVYSVVDRPGRFEVSVPQFLYHARQGWSAGVDATARSGANSFTVGLISDGDSLLERFAGLAARYERENLGTERVRLVFAFQSLHNQWNRETVSAGAEDIYRNRQNFEPGLTVELARGLALTAGASFARFQMQYPEAYTDSANAATLSLRHHRGYEHSGGGRQDVDAAYHLRAASAALGSDWVYTRHKANFRYLLTSGRHILIEEAQGGFLSGRAPLFERFAAGNSSLLRGWNKFDLVPVGAGRLVHNTVEYRYRLGGSNSSGGLTLQVFYDTGAVWNEGDDAAARHSLGAGLREGGFSLSVAFPLREGRVEPVLIAGMNF
jgi:Omp85 superfamily domain